MNDFSERVFQVVREIPRGKVTNYGFVAFAAGNPRASRGVGFVLHRNTDPVNTPCHRVVFKDGSLCKGYVFGGPDVQREKLKAEGVQFLPDGRVNVKPAAGSAKTKITKVPDQNDQSTFRFY